MIARSWRALRTGIAFAVFGLYSLWIFATTVPWARLMSRDPHEQELRIQTTVRDALRWFIDFMCWLGLMHFRVENAERLAEPGILVVANHPTLIDAVALMGRMPKATVVTKHGNQTNFFMGGTIRGAGYISNQDAEAMVAACAKRLGEGYSLVLFPEGTRSPKGALGPFQRGAARIAIEAKRDILPAIITCDPPTLMKDQPWWDVPDGPFEYSIRLGAPISVAPYVEAIGAGAPRSLVARQLVAELRETFEKGLGLQVRP